MASEVGLRDYRVFLANSEFRSVLIFSALARLPFAMLSMSVLFYVENATGSFAWAGALASGMLVGMALGSVLQGRLIDAFGPGVPLRAACLVFLICVSAVIFTVEYEAPGMWQFLFAMSTGFAQPNIAAASRAVWGRVVTDSRTVTIGASYEALSLQAFFVVGPGLAGGFAIAGYSELGLGVGACVMVVGTLGFCQTRLARKWPKSAGAQSDWMGIAALVGALRYPGVRALATAALGLGICLGGAEVSVPAALRDISPGIGGLLLSGWTVTSVLFAIFYGARPWPRGLHPRISALLGVFAACIALMAIIESPVLLGLAVLLSGCFIAVQTTAHSLALQHVLPQGKIAEGFAWTVSSMTLGAALGQALGGQLIERSGVASAFAVIGVLGIVSAVAVLLQGRFLPGDGDQQPTAPSSDRRKA